MRTSLVALLLCAWTSSCALLSGTKTYPPVALESGLVVQDLVVPDGPEAGAGSTATLHYHGTLDSGDVFDSSVERGQPVTFVVGAGEVPPGLDEGVVGMHLFGRRRLTAPVELMFPEGAPPELSEHATLHVDIELIALE